ncbi:amidohydrolase [Microcella alkalica]|uniref:Amidohydrolase 3 domain-containing protein n=1 Tax=Microcella alkalica TaxID=355930 RepID=A0A839E863_9MICO|nr:amidohydrolase [Microcella alkalica]MBA8848711.1 hypothetical protein [Microcella alkalica]
MYDSIFVGGLAFTAGWPTSRAVGVGVLNGRIAAVEPDDVLRKAGARDVIELEGGLIMPAFHDAHAHPIPGAIELMQCDLSQALDADDALRRIAAYASSHLEEEWILGGGWSMPHFAGGTPTRKALDEIVPDRPVALLNRDHHGVWVNSRALERAGIDRHTLDPTDGRIEREPDGSPAGVLHEGAMHLLDTVRPRVESGFALRALRRAHEEFFALGVVGWQDAYVGATAGLDDLLDTYQSALSEGQLSARVTAALWWQRGVGIGQLEDLLDRRARVESLGRPDVLLADTVKIMVDGVAENFSAAMSQPYTDPHGHGSHGCGTTFLDAAELTEAVIALDAADFSVHMHALGDRAVTIALDALEAARAANGPSARRHQLAHLQVVQGSDVDRFAQVGAFANLQLLWGAVDDQLEELTFPFLSPSLIDRHYPFRELRDAGASLAAGSDWPVSSANPWEAIHVAVNRALPGRRADSRINPSQAIDLATALSAYTAGSAAAGGRAGFSGALRRGLAADLVVLSTDPFAAPPELLHKVQARRTYLEGRCVFGDGPS